MTKMKKSTTLIVTLLAATAVQAQTNITNSATRQEWGAHNSNAVAIDVNNDGLRDLVVAGIGNNTTNDAGGQSWEKTRKTHVLTIDPARRNRWFVVGNTYNDLSYFNDGININVADRPSLSACDMNQDGIMDIVAFETSGRTYNEEPFIDNISREGIFLGNGDGTFEQYKPAFVDAKDNPVEFDMRYILSGDVADFNNDGLPDIVGIGYQTNKSNNPKTYTDANVILLNRGGGVFEVSYFLTDPYVIGYGQDGKKYHFECGQVLAYDFNNDGYVDFFINSNSNDREALGTTNGNDNHFTDLFLNDPQHPGQFRRQYVTFGSIPAISEGAIAVADFNNDGTPDIFLSGWSGNGRGKYVYGIYTATIADNGTVTYKSEGTAGLSEMRGQNSTNRQYGAMDWDGDGNFDIFNLGWSPRLSTQTCLIGLGDGNASFNESYRVGGGSEGCVVFVDYNGDGVNDYVTLSQTSDGTFYSGLDGLANIFSATNNPNKTVVTPQMPKNLKAETADGKLVLTWDMPDGAVGNETFEYYVMNADGKTVAGGNSFIGGEKDGVRKVNQPGNAYNARKVTLCLPDGSYTVGVQTVNASYNGSTFATVKAEVTGSTAVTPEEMVKPEKPEEITDTYSNPVIDVSAPDPTVIRADDGYYYLYGTEDTHNTPIYKSKNLVDWDFIGTAFTDATRPTMVPNGGIWAPDINKIGDKYVLYFSKSEWSKEWECGIGCAVADSPEGPFLNAKKLFISNEIGVQNSIDPFYIEDNGHKYLFWGSFRGIYGIELSDDGLSIKDGAKKFQIAGTLTEGTYIIKHDGYYYLFGSAGSCCDGGNSTYHVMVARSENLTGPYVNKVGERALDNQFSNFLYRSPDVVGPGHNSEFVLDDAGQYWMLYHGYDAKDTGAGRKVFLDKVTWGEDGWPVIKNLRPSVTAERPVINDPTGIESAESSKGNKNMSVSPRRVHDKFTITMNNSDKFRWQLVTVHGEKMKSGKGTGSVDVEVFDVPDGLYIVNVRSKSGSSSEKIIKY